MRYLILCSKTVKVEYGPVVIALLISLANVVGIKQMFVTSTEKQETLFLFSYPIRVWSMSQIENTNVCWTKIFYL